MIKSLFLSILLIFGFLYCWSYRNYSGQVDHTYSQYGRVEIYRDEIGVPHIRGKTYASVAFGHGYAQAQDRLFQIFLKTKLAKGQISEIKGESGLPYDIYFRTLGIHRVAKTLVEKLPKEDLEII